MSTQKYYGLVTERGHTKLRAAMQGTAPLTLSHMAYGDGGGQEVAPGVTATALVNERFRSPLSDKRPHDTNPSILYVEGIIPSGIGGWTLREAGIYDSDGDLIVIAKTPSMDVALLAEGASTEGLVRLPIVFESVQDIELLVDPTVLLATQSWVIERILSRPFITVESITLAAPPATPAPHALYVVPANATGAWAGKAHQMAYWHGAWLFAAAPVAKIVGTSDTGKYYRRTATGWEEFTGSETEPGFTQFATLAEHKAGIRKDRATHPAGVAGSVQSGAWNYAVASGTANALTVTLNPAPAAPPAVIYVKIVQTNTAPATISINGMPAVSITRIGGDTLVAGDLSVHSVAVLVWDGVRYQSVSGSAKNVSGIHAIGQPGIFTFTVPDGVFLLGAHVYGGGGGAAMFLYGGEGGKQGEGGGGGGYTYGLLNVVPGQTVTGYIGEGGGTRGDTDGGTGGTSAVGSIWATGGGGGTAGGGPGGGGVGGGGLINLQGQSGVDGGNNIYIRAGFGGDAAGPHGGKGANSQGISGSWPGGGGMLAWDGSNITFAGAASGGIIFTWGDCL